MVRLSPIRSRTRTELGQSPGLAAEMNSYRPIDSESVGGLEGSPAEPPSRSSDYHHDTISPRFGACPRAAHRQAAQEPAIEVLTTVQSDADTWAETGAIFRAVRQFAIKNSDERTIPRSNRLL